ncbi:MAG: hypothetical protein WC838_06130 [Candidatus Margulisiibacteriota bacterium]|jgi:hypothetical protein
MKRSLLSILILAILSMTVFAVPNQLTYSGRLLQNGALVNSTLTMTFKIYKDLTSVLPADLLWSTSNISVEVNQGIYSVTLDQVSPNVFVNENAYLEVIVGSETLAPRTKINSVGYALQAGGLSNGGVQAVVVSNNGFVGIGTPTPSTALEVAGSIRAIGRNGVAYIMAKSIGGNFAAVVNAVDTYGVDMRLQANAGYGFVGTVTSHDVAVVVSNNHVMRFNPSGNVGIGTTAPNATLHLSQNSIVGVRYDTTSAVATARNWFGGTSVRAFGDFGFWQSDVLGGDPINAGTARLYMNHDGYVGIGTTLPGSAKLHTFVSGNSLYEHNYLSIGNGRSDSQAALQLYNSTSNNANWVMYVPANSTNLRFYNAGTTGQSAGDRMTITSAGNVGIGTTAPDQKLVINGKIKVILESVNYPDLNVVGITNLGYSGATGAQNWAIRGVYQYPNGIGYNAVGGDLDIIKALNANTILATKTDGTPLGNVGIGTITPGLARLDIAGGADSTFPNLRLSSDIWTMMDFYSANANAANRNWRIASVFNAYGRMEFLSSTVAGGAPNTNRMSIDGTTGYVGIGTGTGTPGAPLEIGGDTNSDKIYLYHNGTDKYGFGLAGGHLNMFSGNGGNIYFKTGGPAGTNIMTLANNGNLTITGLMSKAGGTFKIDHPLDPKNKYLYHSFVESPDMLNIYNGIAVLDAKGEAVVKLPDWFDALNKEFRYQLTCIGGFAQVYIARKIEKNMFTIAGGKKGMEVSWQVTGVRQDKFANAHRIQVEENKPAGEKGKYLHPKEWGQK